MAYPVVCATMDRLIKRARFKVAAAVLFSLLIVCTSSTGMAQDHDIGLRLRQDGENVPIAVKPKADSSSPLRIRKDGATYGIELVPPNSPMATKARIKVDNHKRALKRYMLGNFVRETAKPKYGKRFLASITCRRADGTTVTIGGTGNTNTIVNAVNRAINENNLPITKITGASSILRATGGTGRSFRWNKNGKEHIPTLEAVCRILGYESYVSSTSADSERSWRYPKGKWNYHTPHDNYLYRWVPSDQ